jgi:hypothetical protein
MPFLYILIRDEGEGLCGQVDGKRLSCIRVLNTEFLDGSLDERDMFFGSQ